MNPAVTFGDHVKILSTPETEAAGIASRVGTVYGMTTPSVTGVEVLGELTSDYAVNVFVEELDEAFWLAPELVQFIDHAPGTEIHVTGSPVKSVRRADGSWEHVPVGGTRRSRVRALLNRLFGRD